MSIKLRKDSSHLANVQLSIEPKGYSALEVDMLLDQIIKDYEIVENNVLISQEDYNSLKKEIEKLKNDNLNLKIEIDTEKSKWKYIKNDGKDIHIDNLELLQRIGKLEKIIYEKLHLNPDEIQTFDPDDY